MEPFNSKKSPKGAALRDNTDMDTCLEASKCSPKDLTNNDLSPILNDQHAPSLSPALPKEGANHRPPNTLAPKAHHPQQATPTAAQTTPPIQLATPINLIRSSASATTTFHSLQTRHVALDPFLTLPLLKKRVYGCPSTVQRLVLERRLKEHNGCVNCINFSWGGKLLASGSDDLQVVLWDWTRGKAVSKFDSGHVANVFQVSIMIQWNL